MESSMFDGLKEIKSKLKHEEESKKDTQTNENQKNKEKKLQEEFERYLSDCGVKKHK